MEAPAKIALKTLIVDENPIIRKLLTAEVGKAGNGGVTQAANGAEALAQFAKESPRIVILNLMLPDMNGIELCRRIKEAPHGKFVIVLMIMESESVDNMAAAIQAGVDHFITIPVRQHILEAWLIAAQQKQEELLLREKNQARLEEYNQEMESLQEQLEASIARANQMAMAAEKAYIELNQIFRTVAGGIVLIDTDCNIVRHNDAFFEIAGIPEGQDAGKKCYETFHSCLCNSPDCPMTLIKEGGERVEKEVEKKYDDGRVVHYHIVATAFKGPGGDLVGIVEHVMDVTEMVKAKRALEDSERKYRELSIVDELTGLFNKRHFNITLRLETERAERYKNALTLLMLDIDNFKKHNDSYGHDEGDKVLARLGEVVATSVRTNDVPCRYGGEEFGVILPETTAEEAVVVAERIRTTFAAVDFYPRPDEKVNKTMSIGIAQYVPGNKVAGLIKHADENLYEAKQQGKNRYVLK